MTDIMDAEPIYEKAGAQLKRTVMVEHVVHYDVTFLKQQKARLEKELAEVEGLLADLTLAAGKKVDGYDVSVLGAASHAAVTVSAPISISTQALSIVNDAAATVTEVDTGALGNVDTTIPTSKVVTTAISTHAALKTGVHGHLNSIRIRPQVTPDNESTGAVTIHVADMLLGIVTGNPSAARAYTLDIGSNCDAGMTIGVDEAFDWCLINIATTNTYIITVTASAGHTIIGSPQVAANSSTTGALWGTSGSTWRTRKTAANTFVTYRIG